MRHTSMPWRGVTQEPSEICLICLDTMGAEEAEEHNCGLKSSGCSEGLQEGREKLCQNQVFSLLLS